MRDALDNLIEEGDILRLPPVPAEKVMEDFKVEVIHPAVMSSTQAGGPHVKLVLTQRREIMIPAQIGKLEYAFIIKKGKDAKPEKSSLLVEP